MSGLNGFFPGFYVVADTGEKKCIELVVLTHPTSQADMSWAYARKFALVVTGVHPWQLEVEPLNGGRLPKLQYEVRWIGKPDHMVANARRFEYRKVGTRKWEVMS